ncbi:MAG: polyprenyl synthetase family protein [Acidobacteriota bacterium]
MDGDFGAFKSRIQAGVQQHLERTFDAHPNTEVYRVARYVALGGGHRWRAMVAVAAGEIFDPAAFSIAMPAACGVELAHTASLVLDDLPSMDDARLRRGKPCVHLVFPRWAVDMAPVSLVTMAYHMILDNSLACHDRRVAAALELSLAGSRMIHGQEIDVAQQAENADREECLLECFRLKCGALFAAAAKTGALLCGADPKEASRLEHCGLNLGMCYQILDDLVDVVEDRDEPGKETGTDAAKGTTVELFGFEKAKRRANRLKQDALEAVEEFGPKAELLRSVIRQASRALD